MTVTVRDEWRSRVGPGAPTQTLDRRPRQQARLEAAPTLLLNRDVGIALRSASMSYVSLSCTLARRYAELLERIVCMNIFVLFLHLCNRLGSTRTMRLELSMLSLNFGCEMHVNYIDQK